jgi:hypothetical protein
MDVLKMDFGSAVSTFLFLSLGVLVVAGLVTRSVPGAFIGLSLAYLGCGIISVGARGLVSRNWDIPDYIQRIGVLLWGRAWAELLKLLDEPNRSRRNALGCFADIIWRWSKERGV